MKVDINLTNLKEEDFTYFLMDDINNYLLNEMIPHFKQEKDIQKISAALDIVRANMNLYSLFHEYDLSTIPPPEPYKTYPSCCSFDVK